MSKHNRTEVVKVLREQMEAATDPKEKVELAKQLAKLLPKPRQARRPRKLETTFPIKAKEASALLAKWAERISHVQEEKKRVEFAFILEVEERRKKPGCADIPAVLTEVKGMLSPRDRAVLEAA